MAITVEELKTFKPGETRPYVFNHPREVNAARVMCSYVTMNFPELKMSFHTKVHRDKSIIIVTSKEKK